MSEEPKQQKKKSTLFRKQALQESQSPEDLDKLIQVVSPRAWIALAVFYLFLFCLVGWGFLGRIPTRVEGKGVLLVENGQVYNAVAPPGGGLITDITVTQGQQIRKDDVIAHLARPDLAEKLRLSKEYVEKLKHEQADLITLSEQELKSRHEKVSQQIETLHIAIQSEEKNLEDVQGILKIKEDNFKKGLLALQDIESTRRDFFSAKNRLEQLKVQLTQLITQEDDFKEQWRQRLKDKEDLILAEQLKTNNLAAELEISKTVTSPEEGIVISVNTSVGKIVRDGASIATITSLGEGLDAVVFMLPHEGQRVSKGMPALVSPTTIEKEEFGSMMGEVLSVSEFPEASETIIALLHNEELTKQFVESGAPTGIRIRIARDSNTFSGYKWSSSTGPDKKILPGTLADVRITVREQPPVSLIIPLFKKLLGVY